MTDKAMWMAIRAALLQVVDAIERRWGLPRTAEARKQFHPVIVGENDTLAGIVESEQ